MAWQKRLKNITIFTLYFLRKIFLLLFMCFSPLQLLSSQCYPFHCLSSQDSQYEAKRFLSVEFAMVCLYNMEIERKVTHSLIHSLFNIHLLRPYCVKMCSWHCALVKYFLSGLILPYSVKSSLLLLVLPFFFLFSDLKALFSKALQNSFWFIISS